MNVETTGAGTVKQAIRKFWGNRPCGVIHSDAPAGSHEFFEQTAEHRFRIHTDWDRPFLKEAVGFERYTDKLVLEVGCGIGVDALEWHRAGNRVVAFDYNLPSCRLTRSRFEDAGAGGVFVNGDAEDLPFPDRTFDVVYSFGVLHHTPGTEKAVEELRRCLKPGGTALVMLYYKYSALIFGEVLWGCGLRRGGLWKTRSFTELVSRYTEWDSQTDTSVNPLTKVYSKREIRKMFGRFSEVRIELHYLWPGHFGPLRRVVRAAPAPIRRSLHRLWGWNAVIRATR